MGLIAGLALGVVLVAVLEFFDDRLYTEKELKNLLPVPVISEIPSIITPDAARAEQRSLRFGWAVAAAVVCVIAAGSAVSYLKG